MGIRPEPRGALVRHIDDVFNFYISYRLFVHYKVVQSHLWSNDPENIEIGKNKVTYDVHDRCGKYIDI